MSLESIKIPGKVGRYFIPEVDFNAETGVCWISGESYLDDTYAFYEKLRNWIAEYFAAGNTQIELNFKLKFFSTSSSRAILELLLALKSFEEKGKTITVNWLYPDPDDDETLVDGEDFEVDSGLTFNYVRYAPEE